MTLTKFVHDYADVTRNGELQRKISLTYVQCYLEELANTIVVGWLLKSTKKARNEKQVDLAKELKTLMMMRL